MSRLLLIASTLFFIFFVGNKSYSQREIHPLEPMFTYDYVLKYYGNLTLDSYWSLENFKAPKGVKSIEQFETFYDWNDSYRTRDRMLRNRGKKKIYYYNKETGFLERTIDLDGNNKRKSAHVYSYKTDSLYLTINVENYYYGRNPHNYTMQYVYDIKTDNLLEIRYDNDNKDIYQYTYDENLKDLKGIKDNSNWRKQEITISYDTLQPIDKIKFFYETGNNYKFKRDSVYLNKEQTLVDVYQRKFTIKTFRTGYNYVRGGKEHYENLSEIESNYISFSSNHISYSLGHRENFHGRRIDNPASVYYPQTGTFLFDENGQLFFAKTPFKYNLINIFSRRSSYSQGPSYKTEESLSILEKKKDNKWQVNDYNKIYLKKKPFSIYNRFKVKRKQKAIHKIKNGSIYKNNKPIIIYNYY